MASKVKCTCGWSWNKSDSSKKDMYICHECGKDNSNNMKNGGWLDNYNDSSVSVPEGYEGEGYSTKGRNYSPAWGGQFQMGGSVYPVNYVPQAQWGSPVSPFTPLAPLILSAASKVKSWFSDDDEPVKKPVAKSNTRTLDIVDPRKKMATTNQPLRPNSDLVGGKYNSKHLDKLMQEAKRQGLSKQDMMNLSAMGFQETKWGKTDSNIGHVQRSFDDPGSFDDYADFVDMYKSKMKTADRLNIKDPALRLQVYNGLGTITPKTEKDYHGFEMQKIYGVPIPKEGINMKKNPLYGKQVMDIRDNVLAKNPEYLQYMDSIYKAPVPGYMEDAHMNKQKPHKFIIPSLDKKEMGGTIAGAPGFTYARTNDPAPDNGPYAKKTMASAQNGGWLDQYDEAQDGKRVLPNNRALQILANIQKRKQKGISSPEFSNVKVKDERAEAIKPADNTRTASKPKVTDVKKLNVRNKTEAELAEQERISDEAIAAERKAVREKADANPLNQWSAELFDSDNWTRQNMEDAAAGLESKFRVSDEPNFFDDWINPASWVGRMAANLGAAPNQIVQQDSMMPLVSAIAEPVLGGAIGAVVGPYISRASKAITTPIKEAVSPFIKKTAPSSIPEYMSLEAPKGNMYGENQVLVQQQRLLNPDIKAKFFENQAPEFTRSQPANSLLNFEKTPKDFGNRITPKNYEDFVNRVHGSTDYDFAASASKKPENLGIGNYNMPGKVFKDAP